MLFRKEKEETTKEICEEKKNKNKERKTEQSKKNERVSSSSAHIQRRMRYLDFKFERYLQHQLRSLGLLRSQCGVIRSLHHL